MAVSDPVSGPVISDIYRGYSPTSTLILGRTLGSPGSGKKGTFKGVEKHEKQPF